MENKVVVSVETGIKEYSEIEAGLIKLNDEYAGKVYDLSTTAGLKVAKVDRATIKAHRTDTEKTRKALKAESLEWGRKVDAGAKLITAELRKLENPIDDLIKADEAAKAEVKRLAKEAEIKRTDGIRAAIQKIVDVPVSLVNSSSGEIFTAAEVIEEMIDDLDFEDDFQEFAEPALDAYKRTLSTLSEMYSQRVSSRSTRLW